MVVLDCRYVSEVIKRSIVAIFGLIVLQLIFQLIRLNMIIIVINVIKVFALVLIIQLMKLHSEKVEYILRRRHIRIQRQLSIRLYQRQ